MRLNKRFIKWSFMIVAASVLFGCSEEIIHVTTQEPTYEFTIGTEGNREIAEITDTFTLDDKIAFELSGNQVIGTPIKIIWIKHNEGMEEILWSYDENIDPTWAWVHYSFENPQEVGEYTIRVFNAEDNLLGEGRFTIE